MQQVRLLSATIALTVLIWASADQLTTERADLSVPITVVTQRNSDWVVESLEDPSRKYLVQVSGRQADVANLADLAIRDIKLTISDTGLANRGLGTHNLSLLEELRAHRSAFPGCAVVQVEPRTMRIRVDRRIREVVPVNVQLGALNYSVEPRVDPATVSVTVLQTAWDRIRDANPRIVLDAESYMKSQPEGEPIRLDVPVAADVSSDAGQIEALSIEPETVVLRATLRQRRKSGTIQAVPIKLVVSRGTWNRYDVQFRRENPPETLGVKVVGSPDEVDKLVSGQRKTFAVINLGNPDALAGDSFQFFKPEFNLPPGVELADDQLIESFEIRLRRRPETTPETERGG